LRYRISQESVTVITTRGGNMGCGMKKSAKKPAVKGKKSK
jgi:hypothetical protein